MNFLTRNWFKVTILVLIMMAFYWYEWKPSLAVKECGERATNSVNNIWKYETEKSTDGELALNKLFYQNCMRSFGLDRTER